MVTYCMRMSVVHCTGEKQFSYLLLVPRRDTRRQHPVPNVAGHEMVEHGVIRQCKYGTIVLDWRDGVEDALAEEHRQAWRGRRFLDDLCGLLVSLVVLRVVNVEESLGHNLAEVAFWHFLGVELGWSARFVFAGSDGAGVLLCVVLGVDSR